ncbi:MAG TPA: ABC transporter permease [Dehalococcoidia bacterium]|nr:ABC transporter permease [Dehalococcoidia bacterium]
MGLYIIRRLLLSIPVLFVASIMIFGGVRVIPGDICQIVLQIPRPAEEQCNALRHELKLDKPAVTQYFSWIGGALTGDLGNSVITKRPVRNEIQQRTETTLELAILSIAFAFGVGVPIGVYSALKQDKLPDVVLRGLAIGWLSMPSFWVGTLLITFPAKWWGYATPVGYVHFWQDPVKNLEQLYLPAIALGLALSAILARFTRSAMLEELRQDYVRTARAKGLRERVVISRHALKNAMVQVITHLGLQLAFFLGGTVILESLFSIPGLGTLLLTSVTNKDFPLIQGLVLVFALIITFINLTIDVSYAWLDPRVRYR